LKNINFDDHPQSIAENGRPIIITPKDHKELIIEGFLFVDTLNATLLEGHALLAGLEGMSPKAYATPTSLLYYGFRSLSIEYGINSYLVSALLNNPHFGVEWYSEPHLSSVVQVRGLIVNVKGDFYYTKCNWLSVIAVPFPNLTCLN